MSEPQVKTPRNHDPRLSTLIASGMGVLSIAVVGMGAWVGNSINNLNITMAKVLTQNDSFLVNLRANDLRDDRQDIQLNQVQREVAVIEGKTFRGLSGYSREVTPDAP